MIVYLTNVRLAWDSILSGTDLSPSVVDTATAENLELLVPCGRKALKVRDMIETRAIFS